MHKMNQNLENYSKLLKNYSFSRGGTYRVTIKLSDMTGQKVTRVVHGSPYVLRAELTPHDS